MKPKTVASEFQRIRKERPEVPAKWAMAWARQSIETDRVWQEFRDAGGDVIYQADLARHDGPVAAVCEPEEWFDARDADPETRQLAERDGVWRYVAYFRDAAGRWESGDSIGGMVGLDFRGSAYDIDILRSALDGREKALSDAATLTQFAEEIA